MLARQSQARRRNRTSGNFPPNRPPKAAPNAKPSVAGLRWRGGARERAQFSPLGGNGVERTLRRRRAQWPGGNFRVSLRFCAPEIFCLAQGITPVMGGPGVSRHWRTKFASAASPGNPLVPFPSLGKEPAPQGGTPCQTARRGRRALQNEESSARRPQAAKCPQNTEKDRPRGAYPQGLSWFKI